MPIEQVLQASSCRCAPGERVPVDGELTEGASLLDESMITGASRSGRESATPALVVGGTANQTGLHASAPTPSARQTMLAQIIRMVEQGEQPKLPGSRPRSIR